MPYVSLSSRETIIEIGRDPKFKVGDYVKVIGGISDDGRKFQGRKGRILEIKISREQYYGILDIECENINGPGGIWLSELQLVKKEIKPYKISDWCNQYYK